MGGIAHSKVCDTEFVRNKALHMNFEMAEKMAEILLLIEEGLLTAIELPSLLDGHDEFVKACTICNLKVEIINANTGNERVRVTRH